jgi:general secretion pathway protein G
MYRTRSIQKGFTLVEILIVVIILGILAAIVIPQFTNASEDARKSSLTSQLQTLRSQVELYKLQHRDNYPTDDGLVDGTWDWTRLTTKTDEDGVAYVDGTSTTGPFGPYLQATPKNSINGQTGMFYDATDPTFPDAPFGGAATDGWMITANGKIFATSKGVQYVFNEGEPNAATNNDSAASGG